MNQQINKKFQGKVDIYTDGACVGNPGIGGWGFIIKDDHGNEIEGSHYEPYTTNNRMEMLAAIKGLESIPSNLEAHVYTDSKYLHQGIVSWIKKWKTNNWQTSNKKPIKNQDLWEKLDNLEQSRTIHWHWIKGHNGHNYNERADILAKNAIIAYQLTSHNPL